MIGRAGVGVDNVDVEAATRRGIVVANAPESTVVSAAEHTIGLLVALARNIPQAHAALKQGRWERSRVGRHRARRQDARRARLRPHRPAGRAPRARARDARRRVRPVRLGASGSASSASSARDAGGRLDAADFLTLHLPLTDETRGSIDAAAFARMRDGARIVNAARGELVDEEALAEALRSGKLAGAALDVFSKEPYSGPLLELDNVVVTPHLAASTDEAQDRAGVIVAEQVVAALDGGLVTNAVNIPAVGADDLEVLRPVHPARREARPARDGARRRARRRASCSPRTAALADYDTRLLTVAALNGAFQGRADQPGELRQRAADRRASAGSRCARSASQSARDYTNLVRVEVGVGDEEIRVAGTTIGSENRLWLVSALGFDLEIELAPLLVFFRYDDVPGVIGRVGTLFGEAGVNIANMAVSRTPPRRQGADGALDRLCAAARARRAPPRRRLRRRTLPRPRSRRE